MKKGQGKGNQPKGSTKRGAEEPAPSEKVEEVEESADNGAPKKIARTASPPKKVQKVVKESEDDVEVVKQDVKKTDTKNKKPTNGKKAAEQEREDEDESEVGDDEATDDNQRDDNGEEENGDEEDDSDAPTAPSKIKYGPIPIGVDPDKVIHVAKLPKKCKEINLVEAFAKYGPIYQIHLVDTQKKRFANIAFKTAKSAHAAVNDEKKVKIDDSFVVVTERENKVPKDEPNVRKVVISHLNSNTTEEQLRMHFKSCGKIDHVKLETIHKFNLPLLKASITFNKNDAVQPALNLHNSILNDSNIKVNQWGSFRKYEKDENLTVSLKRKGDTKSIEIKKLESIFAKCGEIDNVEMIFAGGLLGFITFKTEEAAKNALAMNGKTIQGLELDLAPYSPLKLWTSVVVKNIPKNCTEEDIKSHFAKAGDIVAVTMKPTCAIIRFADSDGFCKSFLYTESYLKGSMLLIEPFASGRAKQLRKQKNASKRHLVNHGFKAKNKKPKLN